MKEGSNGYSAVLWATENDIMKGLTSRTFGGSVTVSSYSAEEAFRKVTGEEMDFGILLTRGELAEALWTLKK